MPKPQFDYEARRSEGLRINFDHLGRFNVHPVHDTWPYFAFHSHRNAAAGIQSYALGLMP